MQAEALQNRCMALHRITSHSAALLHDIAGSRRVEHHLSSGLPPHTLMQRAGLATARLAMALAPHAKHIWIACGPGNNGGDGWEAAAQLQRRGSKPIVTFLGDAAGLPPDAARSRQAALDAGVQVQAEPPSEYDLAIDALLGLGSTRAPEDAMAAWLLRMHSGPAPVLSIDLPSGLDADTGRLAYDFLPASSSRASVTPRHCLSMLTLKPGLLTGQGRDAAGDLWFADLDADASSARPVAELRGEPKQRLRLHASHKGSFGEVAVIAGAPGMTGAALLAATAALHAGAGRVYVALLDSQGIGVDTAEPALMFRPPDALDLREMAVACGCGGGDAVKALLPRVISTAKALVLDADALNAIATDTSLQALLRQRTRRGAATVMTPHPLEAARLLASDVRSVQSDRLAAGAELASRFGGTVVLKGSGSVITQAGRLSVINPTGNARLATAGTGDVLAGMIASALASGADAFDAAADSVWRHGHLADEWPDARPFSASALARG